jgi:hypothetical protein
VLLASVVSIALAAEPGPLTTRFSAGVDGAAAGLLQLGSTHERFASMGQGSGTCNITCEGACSVATVGGTMNLTCKGGTSMGAAGCQ